MFVETGDGYLSFLTAYTTKTKGDTERTTEVLRAETATLEREAGMLNTKIESQKRIAQEKLRIQKERVRASARFIEKAGASRLISKLQSVFPRINEANPVMLENGDIITGFDPATMTFTGSFSPSLGERGAEGFRVQETFMELLNRTLGQEIISLGASGLPVFRLDDEIVDRAKFDAFVAGKI